MSGGLLIKRRSLLVGIAASLIAAPAIVRAASIMPVKAIADPLKEIGWAPYTGQLQVDWQYYFRVSELLRNDPLTAKSLLENPPVAFAT